MSRIMWSNFSSLGGGSIFSAGRAGAFRLRLDLQAAAEHRDHRVRAVDRLGRVQFLPGTVQQPVPLAPQQQLQVLLYVVGLDRRLLPLVAFAEIVAEEFDAGGVDLHLLAGRRDGVIAAVALDVAFDDLPIAEQQDTGAGNLDRAGGRAVGGGGQPGDEQKNRQGKGYFC